MKISIVTPSFNRIDFLDETIESVVSQAGPFSLQYIIQDGGSDPEIIRLYERWSQRLQSGSFPIRCEHLEFSYHVEKDLGMYDAITRGFEKADGDVYAWINSDDLYHRGALNTVARTFNSFPEVDWVTGQQTVLDSSGSVVMISPFPDSYSSEFLRRGFYQGENAKLGFPFVQQESTFWRSELWKKIGGRISNTNVLASDYQLWRQFAAHADLVKIDTILGAFRMNDGQLSGNIAEYAANLEETPEVESLSSGIQEIGQFIAADPVNRYIAYEPEFFRKKFSRLSIPLNWLLGRNIVWDHVSKSWRLAVVPLQSAGFQSFREALEIMNNDNPAGHLVKARALAYHSLHGASLQHYNLYLERAPGDAIAVAERAQILEASR